MVADYQGTRDKGGVKKVAILTFAKTQSIESFEARFADLGVTAFPGSTTDFAKLVVDETEKWAKVIKFF